MPLPPVGHRKNLFQRFHAYPLPGAQVADPNVHLGPAGQGTQVISVQSLYGSTPGFDGLIVSNNPEELDPAGGTGAVPPDAVLCRVPVYSRNPSMKVRLY